MEQIDRALERLEQRRGPEIFQAPTVRSLLDIKRLLVDFDPARYVSTNDATLQTELESADEHGRAHTYRVSARTQDQTKRSILLAGFDILKTRLQLRTKVEAEMLPTVINGVAMRSTLQMQTDGYIWIEPLLARWLSAYRDGLWICWDLPGYTYRYNIWEHRLMRVERGPEHQER
jgi:hypothetical protein